MSNELKPCPMCGDPLEIVYRNGSKYARCITCVFETARHGYHIPDDELKRRCNRRPAEDALKAENERLKKTIDLLGTESCIYQRANNIKDICKDALNFGDDTHVPANTPDTGKMEG